MKDTPPINDKTMTYGDIVRLKTTERNKNDKQAIFK